MSLNIGKGWHGESHRHSLARKGIKTANPNTSLRILSEKEKLDIEKKQFKKDTGVDLATYTKEVLVDNKQVTLFLKEADADEGIFQLKKAGISGMKVEGAFKGMWYVYVPRKDKKNAGKVLNYVHKHKIT